MQVRNLLTRCRHAQEEMRGLSRQMQYMHAQKGMQNTQAYHQILQAHEQDTINQLALLEDMIATLANARTRTVMRYFYTMGWSDAQISEEMELTEEWVRKKRYAAIRELEKEWKDALA